MSNESSGHTEIAFRYAEMQCGLEDKCQKTRGTGSLAADQSTVGFWRRRISFADIKTVGACRLTFDVYVRLLFQEQVHEMFSLG
jgi:hypothetical protein